MIPAIRRWLQRSRHEVDHAILCALDDNLPWFGYDLSRHIGIRAGRMYPALTRLHEAGWISDGWEDAAVAQADGRPRRRWYRITADGRQALDREVQP